MTKLLPVVVVALILAALSEQHSVWKPGVYGEKVYLKKDRLFYVIMSVILILFVGLRTGYNDTGAYKQAYELLPKDPSVFQGIDWAIGNNPGFKVMNGILRILGVSTQNFLMFYAVLTVGIYLWFLRKYTADLWMTVFLFITMGTYTFTMAAIKQCVAVAFCLVGVDRALQKKWISYVFWTVLACTFHPYSLMYAAVPFLLFRPWTGRTFVMLLAFGIAGIGMESLLGSLINVTTMLGEEYTVEEFSGNGVNIFRLLVVWVPVLLSFWARKFWRRNPDEKENLIMNLTMLNAEIMFVALFGTANFFARLANYFLIFQTLSLPNLFKFFNEKSRKLLIVGALFGYAAYFYYEEAVTNGGFDAIYRGISFMTYLRELIH